MEGRLFTLCVPGDDRQIFAWGIEIWDGDDTEAVTYRRDPSGGKPMFGLHLSAEAARQRYSRIRLLAVVWEDDFAAELDEIIERFQPGDRDEAEEPARRRP